MGSETTGIMFRARPRHHLFPFLLILKIWPTVVFQSPAAVNAFQCSLPAAKTSQYGGQNTNNICQFASTSPRQPSRLYESSPTSSVASLRDRLGLHDRFDRWRFLQKLLDEETAAADTNQVLYQALDSYLRFASSSSRQRQQQQQQPVDETDSPELTAKRRTAMETILQLGAATGALPVLFDDDESNYKSRLDDDGSNKVLLDLLEQILPDPVEDEDGHKGTWDTVIELHGREAVKINEKNATPEWKARCLVTRVLLYHDFLVYGLSTSRVNESLS